MEIEPDFERRIVWMSFAEALNGNSEPPRQGERRYDWEQKITLALSVEEITNLALAARRAAEGKLGQPLSLFHDPRKRKGGGGAAKILSLSQSSSGKSPAFLAVKQGERRISVPLGYGDLFRLETLLPVVAAELLGWTGTGGETREGNRAITRQQDGGRGGRRGGGAGMEIHRDVEAIKTFGDLWTAVLEDFGLSKSQGLAELGVSRQEDLRGSPKDLYLQIAAVRGVGERKGGRK